MTLPPWLTSQRGPGRGCHSAQQRRRHCDPERGSVDRCPFTDIRWLPPEITRFRLGSTPSRTPVDSATGEGEIYLDSSAGIIEDLAAIPPDDMPALPEGLNPVYGFFSFEITGLSSGESVNISLAFPHDVPAGTEYWKHGPTTNDTTPHWYQIPVVMTTAIGSLS